MEFKEVSKVNKGYFATLSFEVRVSQHNKMLIKTENSKVPMWIMLPRLSKDIDGRCCRKR